MNFHRSPIGYICSPYTDKFGIPRQPGLFTHDPEAARALLAEVGFRPGRPLRLTLKTSSDRFRVRLATAIQAQAAKVGIELKVQSYDPKKSSTSPTQAVSSA